MTKTTQWSASLLVFLYANVAVAGGVYKWVDGEGVTHYTDRPPMQLQVETVDVDITLTDEEQMAADAARTEELAEAAQVREGHEAEDAATREQEMAEVAASRQVNCERATERQQKYTTARRLYRPAANGEREYLSSDELDAERAEANATVRDWCDG